MSTFSMNDVEDVAYRLRNTFLSVSTVDEIGEVDRQYVRDASLIIEVSPDVYVSLPNMFEFVAQMEDLKDQVVTNEEIADYYTEIIHETANAEVSTEWGDPVDEDQIYIPVSYDPFLLTK